VRGAGHRDAELVGCSGRPTKENTTMADGRNMTVGDLIARVRDGRA
jgi:hypothetical protein